MSVYEQFLIIASEKKHSVAVVFHKKEITYKELLYITNTIIEKIRAKGISDEEIIIHMKRSPILLASMLACIATGNRYIPIVDQFPDERIKSIIGDCNPRLVITDDEKNVYEQLDAICFNLSVVSMDGKENLSFGYDKYPETGGYCIYTSGTTGKPKGVVINEKSIEEFIHGFNQATGISENKTILAATSFAFDIFFVESVYALVQGWKVVLADETEIESPFLLLELIKENSINTIQITPSRLGQLLLANKSASTLDNLQYMLVGGELFPPKILGQLRKVSNCKILNLYGPTESTIWCAVSTVNEHTIDDRYGVSIGKPFYNVSFMIEKNIEMEQDGDIKGELMIGGALLAKGYENRPDLTEEKFIEKEGVRYYKTGDICVKHGDNFYILGRNDNQIKLNGYRIELEEIERVAEKVPGVLKSVARTIVAHEKNRGIELLYTSYENKELGDAITKFMRTYLPAYMIPMRVTRVKEFQQSINGKTDRNNIQGVLQEVATTQKTEICNVICSLIQEISESKLAIDMNESISNYLNSLEIIQLLVELEENFGIEIDENKILDLYREDIRELVNEIDSLIMMRCG